MKYVKFKRETGSVAKVLPIDVSEGWASPAVTV